MYYLYGVDWHVSVHSSWECVHRVILNVEGHSSGQSLWEEYLSIYPGTHVVILGICRYISMRSSWEWAGMYFDIHQKEGLLRTMTMNCSMSKGATNCRCSLILPVVSVYCLL